MNTIEIAAGNDCTKVATHPPLSIASTSRTQHELSTEMVYGVAASSDSFPESEPERGQVVARSTLPKAGKYLPKYQQFWISIN